jgi:hypothetical protein
MFIDLLKRNYLWFNDLRVLYLVTGLLICFTILMNLILGFAATGQEPAKAGTPPKAGCCGHSSAAAAASNFLARVMFIVNYILFHWLTFLTIVLTAALVVTYLLTNLCVEGKTINTSRCPASSHNPNLNSLSDVEGAGASTENIDLRQFAPLFELGHNETDFLLLRGVHLKKLCSDYLKELYLNIILSFVGCLLLVWSMLNFLINLSVNYAKISTKRKYAEIIYLNSSEMVAFADR